MNSSNTNLRNCEISIEHKSGKMGVCVWFESFDDARKYFETLGESE